MNAAFQDVSEATFARSVLEESMRRPVVVDFWAPWCGPCRTLGPLLEELASKANGAWTLAKVDADEAPGLVREYGVKGIPAVKVFVEGKVAGEFVGAISRIEVESFLRSVVAVAADAIALRGAKEALERRDAAAASNHLATIGRDSSFADEAALLLRMLEIGAGSPAAADSPASPERPAPAALFQRAARRLAASDVSGAVEDLLEIVRADRSFEEDLGRRALLAIFTLLGHEHPLTREGRGKLASILF